MRKGISPVIAITLLVAIAVISAVTLWFWIGSYTAQPALPGTVQKGYTISEVYMNSSNDGCISVDVKNTGGALIENLILEVRDYSTGRTSGINGTDPTSPAYVNISSLEPGKAVNCNISALGNASNRLSVQTGTHLVRPSTQSTSIEGFSDSLFTCA